MLWEWSNDDAVRSMAFDSSIVSWEDHQAWIAGRLQDHQSLMMILEKPDGVPVGQVRFDVVERGLEIDFSVSGSFRGQGYGIVLLEGGFSLAQGYWPASTRVLARVLAANVRSLAVCRRIGFSATEYGNWDGKPYVQMERLLSGSANASD